MNGWSRPTSTATSTRRTSSARASRTASAARATSPATRPTPSSCPRPTAKDGKISAIVPLRVAHRPHRARRRRHRHRVRLRRPARLIPQATGTADHRPLRAPRLQATLAGLPKSRGAVQLRSAHPTPDRRGALLARPLHLRPDDAHLTALSTQPLECFLGAFVHVRGKARARRVLRAKRGHIRCLCRLGSKERSHVSEHADAEYSLKEPLAAPLQRGDDVRADLAGVRPVSLVR